MYRDCTANTGAQDLQAYGFRIGPKPNLCSDLQMSQVVVLDKLDYCATLNNLTFAKEKSTFKVHLQFPPTEWHVAQH